MERFRECYEANKRMWDKFTGIHKDADSYRTKEFLDGQSTLNPLELTELGDVTGRSLLHLQCHFGLDTLSWAREGADVTGVDFSGESVKLAKELTKEAGLDAKFIQANIYDLPDILDDSFDIVFTSYGVHCWLHDLFRWAEIVAHFLRPGGTFYIAEFHPLTWIFDWDAEDDFKIVRSYFASPEPEVFEVEGSYADTTEIETTEDYEWSHDMGEVVTAIVRAGLNIEFLHEHAESPFQNFSFLKKREDGYFYYDNDKVQLPLTYSIKATKPL